MIEFVRGVVDYVCPEYTVIDHNGIGYQILTPNPFLFQKGEEVMVYTYQYVREDIMVLYGFKSREERKLFLKLLQVSGIGPKSGLAILASGEQTRLIQAIEEENETFLCKFPSVGKKTARQMILDLKGKLADIGFDSLPVQYVRTEQTSSESLNDALEGLRVLGYAEREIQRIIPQLSTENLTTDQYIKLALQKLLK